MHLRPRFFSIKAARPIAWRNNPRTSVSPKSTESLCSFHPIRSQHKVDIQIMIWQSWNSFQSADCNDNFTEYLAVSTRIPSIRRHFVTSHMYPITWKKIQNFLQNTLQEFDPVWAPNTKHIVENTPTRRGWFCWNTSAAKWWKSIECSQWVSRKLYLRNNLRQRIKASLSLCFSSSFLEMHKYTVNPRRRACSTIQRTSCRKKSNLVLRQLLELSPSIHSNQIQKQKHAVYAIYLLRVVSSFQLTVHPRTMSPFQQLWKTSYLETPALNL